MIDIVPYRTGWPLEFQKLGSDLRRAFGEAALRIDHIGSTAVPGLCAKDIIDIQVSVAQLGRQECALPEALGYVRHPEITGDHLPPGSEGQQPDWSKFFFVQPEGMRRVNLHVRQSGKPNQRYALLFRDYLASNARVASAYGELKRRLATSLARDEDYPDVKDPAVDLIYLAAEQWARNGAWHLPASDA